MEKKPWTLPRKIWKYNGKSNFQLFFVVGQNAQKKIYNRNMDLLISKLLSKSILDLGEVVKLRIFSLTTSQSQKFISKAVFKWEDPYFYCKKILCGVLTNNKKNWKLDLPLYFQICAEGLRVFFSSPRANFFTKCLVFTY